MLNASAIACGLVKRVYPLCFPRYKRSFLSVFAVFQICFSNLSSNSVLSSRRKRPNLLLRSGGDYLLFKQSVFWISVVNFSICCLLSLFALAASLINTPLMYALCAAHRMPGSETESVWLENHFHWRR